MLYNIFQKILFENHKKEYGCLMIKLSFKDNFWGELERMINTEDLFFEEKGDSYGFEKNPHVTLLYGLHDDVKLKDVKDIIKDYKNIDFKITDVSIFDNDDYDVLKFNVEGKILHDINKSLRKLPHTSSYKDYKPHCTIAYLKKGSSDKYIKKIKDKIDEINFNVGDFHFSMADGSDKFFK